MIKNDYSYEDASKIAKSDLGTNLNPNEVTWFSEMRRMAIEVGGIDLPMQDRKEPRL